LYRKKAAYPGGKSGSEISISEDISEGAMRVSRSYRVKYNISAQGVQLRY